MSKYIEKIRSRLPSKTKLELRITKITKTNDAWKLDVDVYSNGMLYDEYEGEGFIYMDNIEKFHPEKSIYLFSEKELKD